MAKGISQTLHREPSAVTLAVSIVIILIICAACLALQTQAAYATETPGDVTLKSTSHSGTVLTVKWGKVENCTGYQIQYANNRFFLKKKTIVIVSSSSTSKKIKNVSSDDTYYVRIRSVQSDDEGTAYSGWSVSSNVRTNKTATLSIMKSGLMKFELRKAAKQKVPGFDTLQGSCYGGGYAWFLMENRNISYSKGRCKIVKVKLSNMKVVKVSKALKLSHGNDMTYDKKRNRIVVAHSTPVPKKISVVDPSTLKILYNKTVKMPSSIEGISDETAQKYKKKYYNGFGAIAYNSKYDQFVVLLRGENFHHLMILDSDFKAVRFLWLPSNERPKQVVQGMDTNDDYILVGQSNETSSQYNNIMVYDWVWGDLLSRIKLGRYYEFESVFHTGSNFYVGYYTSGYTKILKKLYRRNYIYKLTNL